MLYVNQILVTDDPSPVKRLHQQFNRALSEHMNIVQAYRRFSTFILRHDLGFYWTVESKKRTMWYDYTEKDGKLVTFQHRTQFGTQRPVGYKIDFEQETFELIK